MKIKITGTVYGDEGVKLEGIQSMDDTEAKRLIRLGVAIESDEAGTPPAPLSDEINPYSDTKAYKNKGILQKLADDRGIEYSENPKRGELEELLLKYDEEHAPDESDEDETEEESEEDESDEDETEEE